jgi:signal transduction histidine kinase
MPIHRSNPDSVPASRATLAGHRLLRLLFLVLLPVMVRSAEIPAAPADTGLDPVFGLGSWMWDKETRPQQECAFWRSFEIPVGSRVSQARLRIAADNFYRVFLDGRRIGQGSDWRILTEYDISLLLEPGPHVLAVQAVNDFDQAGVLLGLRIDLADGRKIEAGSDAGWRVVPTEENHWERRRAPAATWGTSVVVAAFGASPWKNPGYATFKLAPPLLPVETRFWQTGWFQASLATVCGIVILLCLYLGSRLVIQSREQQVVRRERARIARDIHDELTAGLTKLVLLGETTQSDLPRDSEMRGQITQLCEQARGLLNSMNETIWVINSQRDTVRDLVSYVCKYAETFLRQTPIRCRFDIERELPAASCDVATRRNLFLAVKESLNNVVRHSRASEVHLRCRLDDDDDTLVFVIEDNGAGFDPAQADPDRNGLSNMEQRAAEVGGTCRVLSRPGEGCRVEFRLPLNPSSWSRYRSFLSGKGAGKKDSAAAEERA